MDGAHICSHSITSSGYPHAAGHRELIPHWAINVSFKLSALCCWILDRNQGLQEEIKHPAHLLRHWAKSALSNGGRDTWKCFLRSVPPLRTKQQQQRSEAVMEANQKRAIINCFK